MIDFAAERDDVGSNDNILKSLLQSSRQITTISILRLDVRPITKPTGSNTVRHRRRCRKKTGAGDSLFAGLNHIIVEVAIDR